mmetsp:Transcript_36489/g.103053  ORF Transcript_36489/g.103053 Transcript_36489/m.103053 type:complete len:221 (+) Transcript_36489:191-853(+)
MLDIRHGSSTAMMACGKSPRASRASPLLGSSFRGNRVTSLKESSPGFTAPDVFTHARNRATSSITRKRLVKGALSRSFRRIVATPTVPAGGSSGSCLFQNSTDSISSLRSCSFLSSSSASFLARARSRCRASWYSQSCSARRALRPRTSSLTAAASSASFSARSARACLSLPSSSLRWHCSCANSSAACRATMARSSASLRSASSVTASSSAWALSAACL